MKKMDHLWQSFIKHAPVHKNAKFRNASRFKIAAPWVEKVSHPALPTRMLSNVLVYNGWQNPHNVALAKELVGINPEITLRGLLNEMLLKTKNDENHAPYVWWIWPSGSKKRAIHGDSNGLSFVKLDHKWQLAYSLKAVGALAGAQGAGGYEELPSNAYFIPWENEDIAKNYY